jgi:hypothetical protein
VKRSLAAGIALALAVGSITPGMAQEKKAEDVKKSDELKTPAGAKSMKARTVKGTVKSAQADGIVIRGKDHRASTGAGGGGVQSGFGCLLPPRDHSAARLTAHSARPAPARSIRPA